ncbi:phage portal protein [Desulfuromonas acetoxidans]|uniref:phage portal protein n=1 Tax=Desulfuromonas acetoxidans TaxID=891 RepID=UPI002931B13D|nr:phage portal protein [Desulfuromonas acetoxidans]
MPLMISDGRFRGRAFEAAKSSRLGSIGLHSNSYDADIRMGLRALRSKSRWLFENNDYAKQFYRLLKINVIGPKGITLQNKAVTESGELDKEANTLIETGFADWGKRGVCDVTGKLSWLDAQWLFIETVGRDGECLVELVHGFPNKYGFAIRFIEADHLDENLNRELSGGRHIRMGIEFDKWDRPIAYHLLQKHPGDIAGFGSSASSFGNQYRRVIAENMVHGFLTERVRQSRGVPWSHTTIRRMALLDGFEEAALTNARAGASKMGFFTKSSPEVGEEGNEYHGSEEDENGDIISEFEPGILEELPWGWDFKEFNPGYPNGETEPFTKLQLRGAAVGWGTQYHALTGDLTDVNFSSIRQGELIGRDGWKFLQAFVSSVFCDPVKTAWQRSSMLTQALPLPMRDFDRLNVMKWCPRTWGWVDPVKDMTSFYMEARSRSLNGMMAERGIDLYEEIDAMAEERKYAKSKGIDLNAVIFNGGKTNATAAATNSVK